MTVLQACVPHMAMAEAILASGINNYDEQDQLARLPTSERVFYGFLLATKFKYSSCDMRQELGSLLPSNSETTVETTRCVKNLPCTLQLQ